MNRDKCLKHFLVAILRSQFTVLIKLYEAGVEKDEGCLFFFITNSNRVKADLNAVYTIVTKNIKYHSLNKLQYNFFSFS